MLLVGPVAVFIRRTYARAKRLILPKGTKMSSLVDKNPADLDTRHLEVIPLERFETMGQTEHVTDLDYTYHALRRWLKPEGWVSHQIDFS